VVGATSSEGFRVSTIFATIEVFVHDSNILLVLAELPRTVDGSESNEIASKYRFQERI